jgi:hypothetical protein
VQLATGKGPVGGEGFSFLVHLLFSPGPLIRTLHDASLLLHLYR